MAESVVRWNQYHSANKRIPNLVINCILRWLCLDSLDLNGIRHNLSKTSLMQSPRGTANWYFRCLPAVVKVFKDVFGWQDAGELARNGPLILSARGANVAAAATVLPTAESVQPH